MNIECCGPLIEIELEIQEVFEGSNGEATEEGKDYVELKNKPSIEGVTLQGDKTFSELGMLPLTNMEILKIINKAEN